MRGFVNVCRHRGHIVARGSGCRTTLQCPYHAWTYALDGSLRRAPRSEREPGFDASAFSLLPISVDTWGPFLFANPDPDAAPLAETIAGIPELVGSSGVDLSSLRLRERVEWEMPANWKNAIENYLECYHCPTAHPALAKVVDVDVDSYRLVEREFSSSQFGSIRPSVYAEGANVAYVPRGEVEGAQYHFIWPSTTVNIEAGRTNLSMDVTFPSAPGRSKGWTDYYYGADVSDEEAAELMAFASQVAFEDQSLVESVQEGLDSGWCRRAGCCSRARSCCTTSNAASTPRLPPDISLNLSVSTPAGHLPMTGHVPHHPADEALPRRDRCCRRSRPRARSRTGRRSLAEHGDVCRDSAQHTRLDRSSQDRLPRQPRPHLLSPR